MAENAKERRAALAEDERKRTVAALERELAGYELVGNEERAAGVKAELSRLNRRGARVTPEAS